MLEQQKHQSEVSTTYAAEGHKVVGGVSEAVRARPSSDPAHVEHVSTQPYTYARRELVEPDWARLPGWRDVTRREGESAQWHRANCVKNVGQLRNVLVHLLP